MTNKDDDETEYDPRLAALLAVHLVGKILDEAYVIAKAAQESGSPWNYVSRLKDIKSHNMGDSEPYTDPNAKSAGDNTIEQVINDVATSTPQKVPEEPKSDKNDSSFLGQGDVVDLEMKQSSQNTSTSTYINKLFDMSEVERVLFDETEQPSKESEITLSSEPSTVVPIFLGNVNKNPDNSESDKDQSNVVTESSESRSTDYSSHSLSADVMGHSAVNDVAFYIDNDVTPETDRDGDDNTNITVSNELGTNELESIEIETNKIEIIELESNKQGGNEIVTNKMENKGDTTAKVGVEIIEITEITEAEHDEIKLCDDEADKLQRNNETSFYENAYLTLNRDYDQCSEDECEPILQDPKTSALQDVTLASSHSSEEDIMARGDEAIKKHDLASTSAVTATTTSSHKSTFSERFRIHSSRLFGCLRGLWRSRKPRKRMGLRRAGSVRSITCALSPDPHHRMMMDPKGASSTSREDWKFNTVNEGMLNSRYPITEEYGSLEEKSELL